MSWPSASEWSVAFQRPAVCFRDSDLQSGSVKLSKLVNLGPASWVGNSAMVFRIDSETHSWAARCFLREVTVHRRRYQAFAQHIAGLSLPFLVAFEYQDEGIRVFGNWYPLIKMEWVEGDQLGVFVGRNLRNPSLLLALANQWRGLVAWLRGLHIAHGGLSHSDILVTSSYQMKLVDYDCVFVPRLQGEKSHELGHRNYQHPKRTSDDYSASLDNFSALVIYLSLLALASDPDLWNEFNNGENLILKSPDYTKPEESLALRRMKQSTAQPVRYLSSCLEKCCHAPITEVPDLEEILAPM